MIAEQKEKSMSKKNWDELETYELLGSNTENPGKKSQYERIMLNKLIEAVSDLNEMLKGVGKTIYNAHQGFNDKADELKITYKEIAKSQSRMQILIITLTLIIALSTVAYVFITWQSVSAMKESNIIQNNFYKLEKSKYFKQVRKDTKALHQK